MEYYWRIDKRVFEMMESPFVILPLREKSEINQIFLIYNMKNTTRGTSSIFC